MLGLKTGSAVAAGMLSILPISLWGHTIDAYQYLGIHKQLVAIFFFPLAAGALWSLLKDGKRGFLFALAFAVMFLSHPYIAYCFVFLVPCMLIALATGEVHWNWKRGVGRSVLWSLPAFLFVCTWLIPFMSSPEIQVIDPYLSRRTTFDVIGCTTAETFRQFFLGGLLDTTRWAGPFGGTQWIPGNEWGWIDNSRFLRVPLLTVLTIGGWIISFLRPKQAHRSFLSLAFLVSMVLFIGPDDFPILDAIPFAKKFQNIHAIFMVEWAAVMLGGLALGWLFERLCEIPGQKLRYAAIGIVAVSLFFDYGNALYERTRSAEKMINVKNVYTTNGRLTIRPDMNTEWRHFASVVDELQGQEQREGAIASLPLAHDDSVLYNLLPLMVDRSVFICGFEQVGGVYDLMVHKFRGSLRDNYNLQKLFNVRFVVNSPYHRKQPLHWHKQTQILHADQYWELARIEGDFGRLGGMPGTLVGFAGSEREWAWLMDAWLKEVRDRGTAPWIVNFTHAGGTDRDMGNLLPAMKAVLVGKEAWIPELPHEVHVIPIHNTDETSVRHLFQELSDSEPHRFLEPVAYETLQADRRRESFRLIIDEPCRFVLFKRAFYRGWEAYLDGMKTHIYRVSPGLQMVRVPRGTHVIDWCYRGPNNRIWAVGAGILGMIIAGFLVWRERRWKVQPSVTTEDPSEIRETKVKGVLPYMVAGIWVLFICFASVQIVSEAYLRRPVIIAPRPDTAVAEKDANFYWNYVVGLKPADQAFVFEVASDPGFQDILVRKEPPKNQVRLEGPLPTGQRLYYRVKLVWDEGHRWTTPVPITVNEGMRNGQGPSASR
ncbi:MAG: hypothetical protein JXO48_06225 [Deltaproteobacteria bacterium]|nr:hypothetical protein [Deltaproteobacteria bacterium]